MSFSNTGKSWNVSEFKSYLATLPRPTWAKAVTLHHTSAPKLSTRPDGLTDQHIRNIRDFYQNDKGWSAGPHLFIDDHRIMGMSPLTERGVHAVSFNSMAIGIEVLGDYDEEAPRSGRGLLAWQKTFQATSALLEWLGLIPGTETVLFHRDDVRTSKSCPGNWVTKDWVLEGIASVKSDHQVPSPAKHCPTCTCAGHG